MAAMLTSMTRLRWYWMCMVRNNKPLAILFLIDVGDEVLSILHFSIFDLPDLPASGIRLRQDRFAQIEGSQARGRGAHPMLHLPHAIEIGVDVRIGRPIKGHGRPV